MIAAGFIFIVYDSLFPKINVSFEYDYDSNLYMLSKESGAENWTVIVHCGDGTKHLPKIEKFVAYPGCKTHEGEPAWLVDYFKPKKIEIQRPGLSGVMVRHPDA